MTPDPAFVKDLTAYDPALRVRFARHRAKFGKPVFMIERQVPENAPKEAALLKALDLARTRPKKLNQARTLDLWEGMRDGYAHVMDVHPALLAWSQVAPELAKADAWRQGGMQALANRMDDEDAAEEKRRDRAAESLISDVTYGAWDDAVWRAKERVNVPVEVQGDGFTVVDRRRLVSA